MELLASVIAVIQAVVSLCRYIYRLLTQAEHDRYRPLRLAIALTVLVAVLAFPAITWPVIMKEAARNGDRGYMAVMDGLEFVSLAGLGGRYSYGMLKQSNAFQSSHCAC
jgi:uncharacterized membrane protein